MNPQKRIFLLRLLRRWRGTAGQPPGWDSQSRVICMQAAESRIAVKRCVESRHMKVV